ncbi:MAG: arsenite efflux transporter metallochaperone ArsD [Opitutaceae bacterium]
MKIIQVYDPPMCCSTGVCGPDVDPRLVRFAADLKWLAEQEVTVERFNLTQTPMAFAENEVVRAALTANGEASLPLVLVDGKVVVSGDYPTRDELAGLLGLKNVTEGMFTPAVAELVAIGAAIAANCEPCLRYHTREAEKLGVSAADMAKAVEQAARVKDSPHQAVLRLATRLTGANVARSDETTADKCCGSADNNPPAKNSHCCG